MELGNKKKRKVEHTGSGPSQLEFTPLPGELTPETEALFFMIVTPGLENSSLRDLEGLLPGLKTEVTTGGVLFRSRLGDVLLIQPKLKVATRLLMRVAVFSAKDFPKLHRKIRSLSWGAWLKAGVGVKVRAASHRSRLRIKKRIEEVTEEAILESIGPRDRRMALKDKTEGLGVVGPGETAHAGRGEKLLCLIRVEDDVVTLSMDLSGDLLHRRGDREDVGRAPLRESYAAAILDKAFSLLEPGREMHWLEPMAGTAVFLREHGVGVTSETSSEGLREFAGPSCLDIKGLGVRTHASGGEVNAIAIDSLKVDQGGDIVPVANDLRRPQFVRFTLIETNPEQRRRAQEWADRRRSLRLSKIEILDDPAKWVSTDRPVFLVVNPPWGKRLKSNATDTVSRQEEFLQGLEDRFRPAFVACVMPALSRRPRLPRGWEQVGALRFRSGGLMVSASFFRVRDRFNQ